MEQRPRKKRLGDRSEGRRLSSVGALFTIMPYLMKSVSESTNYFAASIELSAAEAYIRRKRDEGLKGFGMLHVFIAAYVRTVSQYPAINRFISGKRLYARNNIEVVMTIKKKMSLSSEEAEFKVCFEPQDTSDIVYERLTEEIQKIRDDKEVSTEKVAKLLTALPRPVLSLAVALIKLLDYYGLLPEYILKASPFHCSMVVTDLGSLGIPPVFHHLYDIGNAPVFIAFGAKRMARGVELDGVLRERKYIEYNVATDERICDGYYYSHAFKYLDYLLRNPGLLDSPPEKVVQDVD